jgi:hypothetical protein
MHIYVYICVYIYVRVEHHGVKAPEPEILPDVEKVGSEEVGPTKQIALSTGFPPLKGNILFDRSASSPVQIFWLIRSPSALTSSTCPGPVVLLS